MTDANNATHPDDCACWDCITNHIEERARLELKDEWLGIGVEPIDLEADNPLFRHHDFVDRIYAAGRSGDIAWLRKQYIHASKDKRDVIKTVLRSLAEFERFWSMADKIQ